MGALCYVVLLLAVVCLRSADSSVSTAKKGEKPPLDCSSYLPTPEDVEKMTKCINQAMIEQIIKNITNATSKKIEDLQSELPKLKSLFTTEVQELRNKVYQLEKKLNSSCWPCPQDCLDWRNKGFHTSGIYQVCPGNGQPLVVYCDMETEGGGWIVFQRRIKGSTNFTQTWAAYKEGFGHLDEDFWLGFDKIRLFMKVPNKLRIDLVAYENIKGYGKYNNFHIGNESTHYTLNVSHFTGNITDQLNTNNPHHRSNGAPFSTYDQDHDNDRLHCARKWSGVGYWYNLCNKHANQFPHTMLNGRYQDFRKINGVRSNEIDPYQSIYWYGWPTGGTHKFKGITETKLMFRRKY